MPTYQYACKECGHAFEQFQSFADDALTECPECSGRLRKVFNAVGVVFKGSGFYKTDNRSSSTTPAASASNGSGDSGASSDSSSSSGSSGSSDSSGSSSSGSSGSGSSGGSSGAAKSTTSGSAAPAPAAR